MSQRIRQVQSQISKKALHTEVVFLWRTWYQYIFIHTGAKSQKITTQKYTNDITAISVMLIMTWGQQINVNKYLLYMQPHASRLTGYHHAGWQLLCMCYFWSSVSQQTHKLITVTLWTGSWCWRRMVYVTYLLNKRLLLFEFWALTICSILVFTIQLICFNKLCILPLLKIGCLFLHTCVTL